MSDFARSMNLRKIYKDAAHGRLSGRSDEWFTPMDIISSLGPFDLDPACGKLCPNRTAARK